MGLFDIFRQKRPTALEALQASPAFKEFEELQELMRRMSAAGDGVDADAIPDGVGAFGFAPTNPVPTDSIFGSTAYLGRLRATDGAKVIYERIGSKIVDNAPGPVDAYAVRHPDGHALGTLYLCPYHKRISRRAPQGLKLAEPAFAR